MELFEIATRNKYRFPFKGWINTEDLWDLSVQNLDSIFKTLNKELKTTGEESLLGTKTTEQNELSNKIEIVKHIVSVKLEDKAKAQADANRLIAESLTPELIQQQMYEKWNGQLPTVQAGSDSSIIVDAKDVAQQSE